jgi:23S rRNA (cytosine1962-C5)-methyltransferase
VTRGSAPPAALTVLEEGIPFEVEIVEGLHTGLFTDMREERVRLRRLARGRKVLNTFAYTGAFSVAAAAGGAAEVTSVDVVPKALERAKRNFRLAGLDPDLHRFARMDVLEFLRMAARRGWRFDAIVLDPPTFARFKGGTWSLRSAYGELVRLALAVLAPGGILWAAANTESIPAERFEKAVAGSFEDAGRAGSLLAVGGLPPDYPTPLASPRARYLKVHVIRAD